MGKSQGNISFGASRKIQARPVVIAPSWATALFAQTTAEPLNGGPGLSQKPEHTTGGEERRSLGLSVFVGLVVCVLLSVYLRELSLEGTPSLTLMILRSWCRLMCVSVLPLRKEAGQPNYTATLSSSPSSETSHYTPD